MSDLKGGVWPETYWGVEYQRTLIELSGPLAQDARQTNEGFLTDLNYQADEGSELASFPSEHTLRPIVC